LPDVEAWATLPTLSISRASKGLKGQFVAAVIMSRTALIHANHLLPSAPDGQALAPAKHTIRYELSYEANAGKDDLGMPFADAQAPDEKTLA
jgi:hypothetical protein